MRGRSLEMSEKDLADLYQLMEIATRENGMATSRTAKASTKEEIRVENIQGCGSKVCWKAEARRPTRTVLIIKANFIKI